MPVIRPIGPLVFLVVGCVIAARSAVGGVLIGHVLDDATGRHVPARIYVTGPDGKSYLPQPREGESIVHYDKTLGQRERKTLGSQVDLTSMREVYACVGAHPFRTEVPPGKTVVTIERGKEYQPLTRAITVAKDQTVEATFRLVRLFNMAERGWYSGDVHVHTSLKKLPTMQRAEDLNVAFPLTAWTLATDQPPCRKGPDTRAGHKTPAKGELITVDETHVYWNLNTEYEPAKSGVHSCLGALIILGHTQPFPLTAPPIQPVVEEARRQGAILDCEKHCWPWSNMLVSLNGVDTIELSNNHIWRLHTSFSPFMVQPPAWMTLDPTASGWVDYGFKAYYALLNSGFTPRPSAGTANGVKMVPLGYSRVYVNLDGPFSYAKWMAGLKKGRSFVTTGPMLLLTIDKMMPGDRRSLPSGKDEQVHVTLEARSVGELDRVEIIVNGKVIPLTARHVQAGADDPHYRRYRIPITLTGTSWVAARCFEKPIPHNVRFAHTAPIFFDDPARPLLPDEKQIYWLIASVQSQIYKLAGKLPDAAMAEFHQAVKVLQAIADKRPARDEGR